MSRTPITLNGEEVMIPASQSVVEFCGFKDREDVRRLARKFARGGEPFMKTDDVVEYFKKGAKQ